MNRSMLAARALLLGVLGLAPLFAHAEEWRWCAAGDVMDSGPPNGPFLRAEPFRVDGVPDFQAAFEAHMRDVMAPIQGELTLNCSPAFPDRESALSHQMDWIISLEGAIPVRTVDWAPEAPHVASPSPEEATASAGKRNDAPSPSVTSARAASSDSPQKPAVENGSAAQKERDAEQRRQDWERARTAAQQGGKPLRFVLWVGLQPQVGDTSNPSCYSNVITRPGPPGWGAANPATGVPEQAIQIISGVENAFIAKCRAVSGREIAGIVRHERNQSEEDEAAVDRVHAVGAQDVTVQMD